MAEQKAHGKISLTNTKFEKIWHKCLPNFKALLKIFNY